MLLYWMTAMFLRLTSFVGSIIFRSRGGHEDVILRHSDNCLEIFPTMGFPPQSLQKALGADLLLRVPPLKWASPLTNTQPVNCQNMFIIFLCPGWAWRWGNSIPMQQKRILLLKLFFKMPWISYLVTHSGLKTKPPENGRLGIRSHPGTGDVLLCLGGPTECPERTVEPNSQRPISTISPLNGCGWF